MRAKVLRQMKLQSCFSKVVEKSIKTPMDSNKCITVFKKEGKLDLQLDSLYSFRNFQESYYKGNCFDRT